MIWAYLEFIIYGDHGTFNVFSISRVDELLYQQIETYFSTNEGDSSIANCIYHFEFDKFVKLRMISNSELEILKIYHFFRNDECNSFSNYNLFNVMDSYFISQKIINILDSSATDNGIGNMWIKIYQRLHEILHQKMEKLQELYQILLDWELSLKLQIIKYLPETVTNNSLYDSNIFGYVESYLKYDYYYIMRDYDFVSSEFQVYYSDNEQYPNLKIDELYDNYLFFFSMDPIGSLIDPISITLEQMKKYEQLKNYGSFKDIIEYMETHDLTTAYVL